jgi:hypothetical protein
VDVRLRLGPEDLTPALVRKVVRHGGKDSFEEASVDLREDAGVEITSKQVQRITARVGTEWAAQRDREAKAFLDPERVARLVAEVQSHGAVPAARTPKGPDRSPGRGKPAPRRVRSKRPRRRRPGRRRARRRESRYLVRTTVATMRRSDRFGEMLAMEAFRRSLDLAPRKAYVCDGQAYNWTIWGEHFRDSGFVPVLDFVHLLTYVYSAAHAAGGSARGRWQRYER